MSNLETVRGLLTLLDKEELKSINETINGILNTKGKPFLENKDLKIFYMILNRNFNNMYPNLEVLKKTNIKLYKKLNTTVEYLNNLTSKILELHTKRTKVTVLLNNKFKITIYGLFISVMESWLEELDIPISLKTITNNHDKFNSLLNKQFPNYIKSGLFVPFVFAKKYS